MKVSLAVEGETKKNLLELSTVNFNFNNTSYTPFSLNTHIGYKMITSLYTIIHWKNKMKT